MTDRHVRRTACACRLCLAVRVAAQKRARANISRGDGVRDRGPTAVFREHGPPSRWVRRVMRCQ
jgi:hypothetical protein